MVVAKHLQARCPSQHTTNSIKALKDDNVPDEGQHAAIMVPRSGQEHCDGCVGCLSSSFQGSIPPVTITVFPT